MKCLRSKKRMNAADSTISVRSGYQGPGNGEAPGNFWNPAVATTREREP